MAGLYRFSKADGNGGRRIDRDELADWARQRFHVNIDVEDFRSKQKDEIHAVLVEKSRILQRQADEAVAEVKRRVEELPSLDPGHPFGRRGRQRKAGLAHRLVTSHGQLQQVGRRTGQAGAGKT